MGYVRAQQTRNTRHDKYQNQSVYLLAIAFTSSRLVWTVLKIDYIADV